jgi:alkylation response protein AidB-like acyl-CoA dehydrogenase
LAVSPQQGLAPSLAAAAVTGTVTGGTPVLDGAAAEAWWRDAEATCRMALAHYIGGALHTMFELARDHASERAQFGRRIGTFQAVRHKLAEAFVAVEAATAAADAAWEADDRPLAAATAKIVASRAAATVVAHAQQVLAGIGFTADHPFHHHMKGVVVLDRLLGDADELAPVVGRRLVERGSAPRLVELS